MRGNFGDRRVVENEIRATYVPASDTLVGPPLFAGICRLCWPHKTAAHIAAIGKKDERTAERWLAGEYEPPASVVAAIIIRMFERS
jgi:hypothetical protein